MAKNDPDGFVAESLDADQQKELGSLEAVTQHLAAWQVPEPTPEERSALVKFLSTRLLQTNSSHSGMKGWLHLIFAQVRLFEAEFWYACAAMLLFTLVSGTLVGNGALTLFTLMISPLTAMVGVLYVFHRDSSTLSLLEAASPVSPQVLFLCRATLILGINLAALLLLLIPGQILFPQLAFWRVALIGLGALVGLFGLATYTTVRWNGLMGTAIPLGIWGLLVGSSWQRAIFTTGKLSLATEWMTNMISASNGLLVEALLAFLCGGWLLFQTARWIKKENLSWA